MISWWLLLVSRQMPAFLVAAFWLLVGGTEACLWLLVAGKGLPMAICF